MMDDTVRDVLLDALNDLTHDVEQTDAQLGALQQQWDRLRALQLDRQARAEAIRQALRDADAQVRA